MPPKAGKQSGAGQAPLLEPACSQPRFDINHLYVHLPFCQEKCHYCSFATYTLDSNHDSENLFLDYFSALKANLDAATRFFGPQSFETVYWGGGTPSVVPLPYLHEFLGWLRREHTMQKNAELTFECNPNSLSGEKIEAYQSMGINRISVGVQSLHPAAFNRLGRAHSIEQSRAVILELKRRQFPNWSVDLMFGLPYQTLEQLKTDVQQILAWGPPHISIYGLMLEKATPFGNTLRAHQSPLPSEDTEADMYEYLLTQLPKHGYNNYEISNFALAGFESRHNLAYWTGKNYLGLGLSAASLVDGQRFSQSQNLSKYLQNPCLDYLRLMERPVARQARLSEKLFLMLRTRDGLRPAALNPWELRQFTEHKAKILAKWTSSRHVLWQPDSAAWKLSLKGKLVANEIMAELV